MKIEQLIVQYLYNNKEVTLKDIGTFTISHDVVIPSDNDKQSVLPPDSISFVHNDKAPLDENLVDFIMQQTRKIKPLATSDLESYSILSKQFLNIGKPMMVGGLGTLLKNQQGEYEFSQANTTNARLEPLQPQKQDVEKPQISFSSPQKKQTSKKGFAAALIVLLVLLVGTGLYYLLKHTTKDVDTQKIAETTDTVAKAVAPVQAKIDTVKIDSVKKPVADTMRTLKNDGYSFKVIIKEYPNKDAAQRALTRLTNYGHTIIMSTSDSVHYKLAIPFTSALSDTLKAKDSLSKFFQAKTTIDLH